MKIEQIDYARIPLSELQPYHANPRRGDTKAIASSLKVRGQYRPIVVNRGTHTGREMEVLAGNHTMAAAESLGWDAIDCGIVDVDDQSARAIVAADNRLADLGDYDQQALAELLDGLDSLTGTGYSDSDLDDLLAATEPITAETDPDDAPDLPEDEDTIAAPGDVFDLGPHRVLCGDSTDHEAVGGLLMGSDRADVIWTDPPYGVSYVGKTKDALTIQNDGAEDLSDLLLGAFMTARTVSKPGAPIYVAHADTERMAFEGAMRDTGILVRQNLVWVKNTLVLGRSDYQYKHEPILLGENPPEDAEVDPSAPYSDRHTPVLYGFTPGGEGRLGRGGPRWFGDNKQTTVFEFDKPPRNAEHPTMKPVELIVSMLSNSLAPGGIVLDLFGGSGSTLIAAHHHRSAARLVELDPRYVDVICRRYEQHTGIIPKRAGKEVSFI